MMVLAMVILLSPLLLLTNTCIVKAIALACCFRQSWPVLIAAPASLCLPWADELERFLPELQPGDVNLVKAPSNSRLRKAKFSIVSYGMLASSKSREALAARLTDAQFDCVICDEAHYLKSKDAVRSKTLIPIVQSAQRRILLTGTPALSRPEELWTLLTCLEALPQSVSSFSAFTKQYCDAQQSWIGRRRIWDTSGSSNVEELHDSVLRPVMIRRLKADVLTELPPKQRRRVVLSLSKSEQTALAKVAKQLGQATATGDENLMRLRLGEFWTETGKQKRRATLEYLQEVLEGGGERKVLVFAHHLAELDAVEQLMLKLGKKLIRIDGGTPVPLRRSQVVSFQTEPAIQVAILSITAAGQGLTLTAASLALFFEMTWVPGQLLQAEDRLHRIGQKAQHIDIHYAIAPDSLDERMWSVLERKVKLLGRALDGKKRSLNADELKASSQGTDDGDGDDGDGLEQFIEENGKTAKPSGGALAAPKMANIFAACKQSKKKNTAPKVDAVILPDSVDESVLASLPEEMRREIVDAMRRKSTGGASASASSASAIDLDASAPMAAVASAPSGAGASCGKLRFCVSSCTYRLHLFLDGRHEEANLALPTGGTSSFSALELFRAAIADDTSDLSKLPHLHQPGILSQMEVFSKQWTDLTTAERVSLHDRLLKIPKIGNLRSLLGTLPLIYESSEAAAHRKTVQAPPTTERHGSMDSIAKRAPTPSDGSSVDIRSWKGKDGRTWKQHFEGAGERRPLCLSCSTPYVRVHRAAVSAVIPAVYSLLLPRTSTTARDTTRPTARRNASRRPRCGRRRRRLGARCLRSSKASANAAAWTRTTCFGACCWRRTCSSASS